MILKFNFSIIRAASLVVICCAGCRNTNSQISPSKISPVQTTAKVEQLQVSTDSTKSYFDGLRKKASVINYYQRFGPDLIWIENNKTTTLADSMIHVIRNAVYYGLPSERYHLAELNNFANASSKDILVRKEILLTDAFLCFAVDLKSGLVHSDQAVGVDSLQVEALHNLTANGNLHRTLDTQEPVFIGYRSLRKGLGLLIDSLRSFGSDSIERNEIVRLASINLERWRAEDANFGERHIFINIPSYSLDVVEQDSVILSSKVIVGKPETETPILNSVVECFTIYPYWHVPRKIAVQEYLPFIKKDTAFITRNNFDVLDRKGRVLNPDSIEWNTFHENYFPVVLRQREGTENSLGIIKFIFDNPYAVYLHDTNAKRLFKNKERAFSHGCIRMEKAVELAHYLVTGQVSLESRTISKYLKEKQQRWIDLKTPIPIYTRYFTCEFRDGILYAYKDLYNKDQVLFYLFDGTVLPFEM